MRGRGCGFRFRRGVAAQLRLKPPRHGAPSRLGQQALAIGQDRGEPIVCVSRCRRRLRP